MRVGLCSPVINLPGNCEPQVRAWNVNYVKRVMIELVVFKFKDSVGRSEMSG